MLAVSASLMPATAAHAEDAGDGADDTPTYEARAVVDVAPLPGAGVPRDQVPANVQVLAPGDTETGSMPGVARALHARVGGVVTNDVQNNPLQVDVSFRGASASPLLGTPQGLAVYQNGSRVNEPFGDVVQWELLPDFAVHRMQLVPGASPVYGLNSLGGSIALQMKSGFNQPGLAARAEAGSFGRRRATLEYGRSVDGRWAVYEGIDAFAEDGFRDHSASSAYRLYADARHAGDDGQVAANLTLAATDLRGNGPAPVDLLERDRGAVFTWPDITDTALIMLAVQTDHALSPQLSLQSNAYLRTTGRDTLNGDEAELSPCEDAPEVLCEGEDEEAVAAEPALDEAGAAIPATAGGSAVVHTTRTHALGGGASLQGALRRKLSGQDNTLVVGTSLDAADVAFTQRAEVGSLTDDRGVMAGGFFLGDDAHRTRLDTRTLRWGLYATDTVALTEALHATVAARLDVSRITLEDRLGDALDGAHDFARLNPAAGATYRLAAGLTLFGGYGESSRVPSAAELGCADPEQPCRVPNAFLADPPLRQVVSRSLELGLRGRHRVGDARLAWSLATFASVNDDDILFVAGRLVGTGYFRNAGRTRRLGGEAGVELRLPWASAFAAYQLLHATFQSSLVLPGDNHPRARTQDGRAVIDVEPGDRLPGLPAHSLKLGGRVQPFEPLSLGATARYAGSHPLRGDEANLLDPVDGYVVVDAEVRYTVLERLTLFVEVENLLDTDHETFGLLGDAEEVLSYAEDPRFLSPGAPRGVWGGMELRLD